MSYRRGLTGVAYSLGKAMRGPKRGSKQVTDSRAFSYVLVQSLCRPNVGVYRLKYQVFMLHIGKLIRQKMEERHKTVVWLAKHLSCTRANVYKILDKYSIDTEALSKISQALDFDFFSLYSEEIKRNRAKKDDMIV